MEQIIMGLVVLGGVMFLKRKQALTIRWQPERGTWVAVGTGLLAFILSASLLLINPESFTARLVLYGGIWVICGVVIPWGYVILVERGDFSNLGLCKDKSIRSLLISLGLAIFFSMVIIHETDWSGLGLGEVARSVVVLIGAGGLFELFLYYGFIHLRLEKAFGTLPAILLTAVIYVLWHSGTQLPLEPDPWIGALKLLGVGIMYQAVFSLTYNLLIIWPFFMGVGVMIDFLVNVGEIERISTGFPWAIGVIVAMVFSVWLIWLISKIHKLVIYFSLRNYNVKIDANNSDNAELKPFS